MEPGGEYHHVDGVRDAVPGHDGVLGQMIDAARHELHVLPREGLVVVVGDKDALPADRVVGQEGFPQAGIRNEVAEVPLGKSPNRPREEAVSPEEREAQLELKPQPPAVEPREQRDVREAPLLPCAVCAVASRQHPVGTPLKDGEVPDLGRDLWDELDGARRVADHRHALAREIAVVAPAGGVEALALEAVETGDSRDEGPIELPDRAHQDLGGDLLTAGRPEVPDAFPLVEPRAGDLGPEADVAEDVVLPGAVVHVVADLCLR